MRQGQGPFDVRPQDWHLLEEVLFFARHPGWVWSDYSGESGGAPEDLIEAMRAYDDARAAKET